MFFKKRFLKRYKEKLIKIKNRNQEKLIKQKLSLSKILNHDIKTIILAQDNCLKLMGKGQFGDLNSGQKEILNQVLSSNIYLKEILNNAIFLSEFEEKTSKLNYENIDIVNEIEECANVIKKIANTKEQNIIIDKTNPVKLNADKKLVQKIIFNLISSSVSSGFEKSDIVISVKENNDCIAFLAKNKSIYMTKEKIKSFFEENKNTCDFNQLGMSLNLNVAKKLIDKHNWNFVLNSKEDNSSTLGFVVKK